MKRYLNKALWALTALMFISSCSKEEIVEQITSDQDKIAINTEIVVDGETVNTRAASEAGYTTGDGLYDKGDNVIVAAYANEGYELVKFYNKKGNADQQDGSTYEFKAETPQTFKAEFVRKVPKEYVTINVSLFDGWTADFHIYTSGGVEGIDHYENASDGTFKVEKGEEVTFNIDRGSLANSGEYLSSATVDRLSIFVNGSNTNYSKKYSATFIANTDARITVNCAYNYSDGEFI